MTLPPLALAVIAYAVFLRNCGGFIVALQRMSPKQPFHSAGLAENKRVNSSRRNSTTQTRASQMFLFQYLLAKQLIAVECPQYHFCKTTFASLLNLGIGPSMPFNHVRFLRIAAIGAARYELPLPALPLRNH